MKQTNKLIISNEFKQAYSLGNSFSRKRKLSFSNAVHFICSALRKSMATEISSFIEEHIYLDFPNISKQAFSKARQNISPEAFKELCRLFVDSFYGSKNTLKKWNGFNVLAVDGTSLQVPDTIECGEYFGLSKNQNKIQTAIASASALYDVLNDTIIDASITKFRTSEREMAKQHINALNNKKLINNSIVIFDRGYPSYDMFDYLNEKKVRSIDEYDKFTGKKIRTINYVLYKSVDEYDLETGKKIRTINFNIKDENKISSIQEYDLETEKIVKISIFKRDGKTISIIKSIDPVTEKVTSWINNQNTDCQKQKHTRTEKRHAKKTKKLSSSYRGR